jgi:processing peptidase subunit alpha
VAATRAASAYTGGVATVAGGKQDFVHVSLGFKAPGWKDDDFVATNVLQYIMGGGSSFSVGGPGKGMYSRLFQNVLNRHYWVNSAQAYTSFFEDAGVFGVSGSTSPRTGTKPLVEVMCGELGAMGKNLSDEEVNRAKNQLKLALYTNVEDRTMAVDDMARQALVYGKYTPAAEICAKIDAVTTAQLSSVAQQIISSEPTLTLYGDSTGMPSMEFVKSKF